MPTSLLDLSPLIVSHVWETWRELARPIRILDVGPGFGRYGLLCRELVDGIDRGRRIERLDAIEAEGRYISRFRWLLDIYDNVILGDVTGSGWAAYGAGPTFRERFDGEAPAALLGEYDLVLMLDVIEHLDHDAALELLDRIPSRILISTPRDYFDNPEADAGWPTERHRSHFPDATSFGDSSARVDRVEVNALEVYGANIVRLGPKP